MYSNLAKGIYDSLLRKAMLFDKEPILKCLLMEDSLAKYYNQIKNGTRKEYEGCQNLLDEFLHGFPVYSFDKSLVSFINSKVQENTKESDNEERIQILLRFGDYLNHQLQHANNKEYFYDPSLPAPREVREFYDRLEPTLVSDKRQDYSGCVLIAHPSLVLVDAVYPETEGFEGAHYPAFVVGYPMVFDAEISPFPSATGISRRPSHAVIIKNKINYSIYPSSRELLESKHELIRNSTLLFSNSTEEKPSNPTSHSRHQRIRILDDELGNQVNEESSEQEESFQTQLSSAWKKWDVVFKRYNSNHPVFGDLEGSSRRTVLTSIDALAESTRNTLEYLEEPKGLMASDSYERVCSDLSKSKGLVEPIPMCVSSLNYYTYPLMCR